MWIYILSSVVGFLGLAYLWMRKKFSFFRSKDVPEDTGYFPLGSKAR
jgi:hypothetical protein